MSVFIQRRQKGFTIVELLIVIVVIGILATITIVAYNGIQDRARASAVSSALTQAMKKISLWQVDNPGIVPAALSDAGVTDSNGVSYDYTGTGTTYCITATVGTTSYYINTNLSTTPIAGGCAGHGQGGNVAITNLVTNPSFETNTAGWSAPGNQGATLTKSSDFAKSGTSSLKVYNNRAGMNGDANQQRITTQIQNLVVGQKYTAFAYAMPTTGKRFSLAATPGCGGVGAGTPFSTTDSSWQLLSLTFTATNTTYCLNLMHVEAASGSGLNSATTDYTTNPFVGYIDSVMLYKGETVYPYADGNNANWIWSGAANNSTSTGPHL